MKKKILIFFIVLCMLLILNPSNIFALQEQPIGEYNLILSEDINTIQRKIKNISKEYKPFSDTMLVTAKVTVTKREDSSGNIEYVLGRGANEIIWSAPGTYLYDEGDKKVGSSWDVWLDIEYIPYEGEMYNANVSKSYLDDKGDFNPDEDGWKGTKKINETASDVIDAAAGVGKNVISAAEFVIDLLKDIVGKILSIIFDWLGRTVGDSIQKAANSVQLKASYDVLYSYKSLKENKDTDLKNKYTNVSSCPDNPTTGIYLLKDENDNDKKDYTKDTKIPVMVGDLYNIAVGHIDFFDVNFLTGANTVRSGNITVHEKDSSWLLIRNTASAIIHISIYAASAVLIIYLIVMGIGIVAHTLDNPEAQAEYKKGLEKLKTSITMLVGSILIMAFCIFFTESIASTIGKTDSYELPIRVNVEGTYSFSTTATGYIRYLSLTEDTSRIMQKMSCTLLYILLAFTNLAAVCIMLIRMFAMWILAILGPLIGVMYVFNIKEPISFRNWVKLYIILSFMQIFFILIYKVIIKLIL